MRYFRESRENFTSSYPSSDLESFEVRPALNLEITTARRTTAVYSLSVLTPILSGQGCFFGDLNLFGMVSFKFLSQ